VTVADVILATRNHAKTSAPAAAGEVTRGRLGARPRQLAALAALLLGLVYLLPLWTVRLVAPQYPEGLGMHIRINTVSGLKPTDLDNINGLNHYIGMHPIQPDAIPELRIMPWVVAAVIVVGLLSALIARRSFLLAWAGAYAMVALAGLADFWKWEYDYGHNLDMANAIIKVPGMNYQPPLIGSKQLLNFTASSWPAPGGILAGLSLLLALAAVVLAWRERRRV
jgi:copper chaperone NosL